MSPVSAIEINMNEDYAAAVAEWKEYALSKYPEEACGFFSVAGKFIPVDNIHETPTTDFRVHKDAYLNAGPVAGFVHSHTPVHWQDPSKQLVIRGHPSKKDMKTQMAMNLPWGISTVTGGEVSEPLWWGDTLPIRPLLGRPFIWGVNDCYSLVRDWHRLQGIDIPDYPRAIQFWEDRDEENPAEDMYEDLFESAGFSRIYRPEGHLVPGDCFICRILSKVRNHAGVYIGGGLILHHTMDRLSKRDPANLWQSKMEFLVRHKDLPDDAEIKDVA